MDNTARLLLQKPNPDPLTGDFLDVSVLNANFDKIDAAMGAAPVTSGTRPTGTNAWDGRLIRETDTGRLYVRAGTEWLQIPVNGPGRTFFSFIDFERDTAAGGIITGKVSGDSVSRFLMLSDGSMQWGSGSAGRDTNLYRSSAGNKLITDDEFQAQKFTAVGTNSVLPPPTPSSLTLQNGWVNYGLGFQEASYYKDATGVVHVTGLIKSGTVTTGTVIANLPAGFRPAGQEIFATPSNDSTHAHTARIDVKANGNIEVGGPGSHTGFTSLAGISFRQAN